MSDHYSKEQRAAYNKQYRLKHLKHFALDAEPVPEEEMRSSRSIIAPERAELKTCLQYLQTHPRVSWVSRINSGAYKDENRYIRFGFKGCADIIGMLKGGRFFAFEVKRKGGRLTYYQAGFLAKVNKDGGIAGWGTIDECILLMK